MKQIGSPTNGCANHSIEGDINTLLEPYGEDVILPDGTVAPANINIAGSSSRIPEWIPEGARNAGNADGLIVDVPASYVHSVEIENKILQARGNNYIIVKITPEVVGVPIIYRISVYRQPLTDSATKDPQGTTRKAYILPDAPTS